MNRKIEHPSSCRGWFLFLIFLAVLLRIVSWSGRAAIQTDSVTYISCGIHLFRGEGLVDTSGHDLISKPPLYSTLIGLFWKFGIDGESSARLVSFLSGVGTVLLLFLVAGKLYGSRIGLAVMGLSAVFPGLIHTSTAALAESTALFLLLAGTFFLLRLLEDWRCRDALLSASFFSLAVWTRSNAILIALAVVPVLFGFLFSPLKPSRSIIVRASGLFLLWLVVSIQPWMAWNYTHTGKWTLAPESSAWFQVALQSGSEDASQMEKTLGEVGHRIHPTRSLADRVRSDPMRSVEHVLRNTYTFYKETLPKEIPPLFLFLAGIGLLVRPLRGYGHLGVLLPFFLPLPVWMAMRGGEPRDVIPLVPSLLVLAGAGATNLWRWAVDLEGGSKRIGPARLFAATILFLSVSLCLPGIFRYQLGNRGQAVEHRLMGQWIRENLPPEERIVLTRKPMVALYAEGRAVGLASGDPESLRDQMEKTGASLFAIDSRTTARVYPSLAALLEPGEAPDWLVPLHRVTAPDGEEMVLYRLADSTSSGR